MNVLRPGSSVLIHGEIPARIMAVVLRELGGEVVVQYQVVWWKEGSRNTEYLDSFEFEAVDGAARFAVGFERAA